MRESTVPHVIDKTPVRTLRADVRDGPDRGASHIGSDRTTVGTAPDADLVMTDPTVSRYHVELIPLADGIGVRDCGSTNQVRLGRVAIQEAIVPPGTILELGASRIEVTNGETVEVECYPGTDFFGIRAESVAMRRLMARVQKVAGSNASVLFAGETGTGKELFARSVHQASPRAQAAFEVVDCSTLVPTLVASELFGHEKGAFTGAVEQRAGAFERANGGTVFLDEIGELPLELQAQLLGVLERKSFRRVGGTRSLQVDVRVVSATHRDLRDW
ncbi:MAG: sigma 54-interacting transcriptional regulator, partial [Myxococcota bacterium]